MTTIEFLKDMTLDQLEYAKEQAERLIKNIKVQEKIPLLVVNDHLSNAACFTEDQFLEAKLKVCELIMSDEFELRHLQSDHPRIKRIFVYKSEVKEWMELNT